MSDHTPGPWIVATSNSWRRIVTEFRGESVITPCNHQYDGHPDLIAKEADLKLAAQAPVLLSEVERLTAECSVVLGAAQAVTERWGNSGLANTPEDVELMERLCLAVESVSGRQDHG